MLDFMLELFKQSEEITTVVSHPLSEVKFNVFTSNGTYTKPTNFMAAIVFLCGGGGAGESTSSSRGDSGQVASTAIKYFNDALMPSSVAITVGASGLSNTDSTGRASNDNATNGGSSSFGTVMTVTGGQSVFIGSSSPNYAVITDAASGGDINLPGYPVSSDPFRGGSSIFGSGGLYGQRESRTTFYSDYPDLDNLKYGQDAIGYGSGGGGAYGVRTLAAYADFATGGDGGSGVCLIIEFLR